MSEKHDRLYSRIRKPASGFTGEDTKRRQEWVKETYGIDISQEEEVDPIDLQGIIEYHVGYMKVPMAVASPLHVQGDYANGVFTIPLCTLEGALVLSMCRGMMATSLCGGVHVRHVCQEISRSPVFLLDHVSQMRDFVTWVEKNFSRIKEIAESTTNHGKLLRINPVILPQWVVLDMIYDTGNAAGQNMVTIASYAACQYIAQETGKRYLLESGFNSDKKASLKNLSGGRGHYVVAEARISKKVLQRILHVSVEDVHTLHNVSLPLSHIMGSLGNNLNISNTLAAIYIATGQDAACISENAIGQTQLLILEDELHVHLTMPSITVGTVGGGTRLPMQKKNLVMLGCERGKHSSRKLAEIIVAATLTLELSLLSAISSDTFADAHQKYGRKQE